MLLPIGEMREVVVIRTPTVTRDDAGGQETTYIESDPLYVSLRAVGSREAIQFGQVNAEVTHVIFGHWHDLSGLPSDARIRLVEDDTEFDVIGLPINDPKRAFTRLNVLRRENG